MTNNKKAKVFSLVELKMRKNNMYVDYFLLKGCSSGV